MERKRASWCSSIGVGVMWYVAMMVGGAEGRAFFVFGDSLVDNGNNNYLATTARADSYPYGIDSPSHRATGRFSNGLNIPDLISIILIIFIILLIFIFPQLSLLLISTRLTSS